MGTEAPLTIYWCVEWVPEIGVARFGTYGRGIWDYTPRSAGDVVDETDGGQAGGRLTARQILLDVSPNPATSHLAFRFEMPAEGSAQLELFDVSGRRIAAVAERLFGAGSHELSYDLSGHHLEAGFYLARLTTPQGVAVRTVRVIR